MRTLAARTLVLLVASAGLALAETGAEEIAFESDTRMIEAGGLMSDRDSYPRVIQLYREVLAEFPDHIEARMWLARVLSWKGDHPESLEQYGRLLALEPPPPDARIERAEVLSWAGDYEQALAAFDEILAEEPEHRRALLGKARVYSWSGHRSRALRAYRDVLALGDDPETRRELSMLRSQLGAGGDARGEHFFDNQGFARTRASTSGAVDLTFETRFIAEGAFHRVERDALPAEQALGLGTTTNGLSGLAGIEHHLAPAVVVSGELGYLWYEAAPGHFLARAKAEATLETNTALGLHVVHDDFLQWSDSFDSVRAGLDGTNLRGQVWQGITRSWGAFAYAETTFVSDGNQRVGLGASTTWRPLEIVNLALGLSVNYVTYTGRSILYYDPTLDVGFGASADVEHPLRDWLDVFAETTVGFGQAEQGGLEGFGFTYGLTGGLRIRRGGLSLDLHGGRRQSQRATVYTSHRFGATVDLEF